MNIVTSDRPMLKHRHEINPNIISEKRPFFYLHLVRISKYLESEQCHAILRGNYKVFVGLITLRKICNHPDLASGGPRIFKGDKSPKDKEMEFGYYKRSGKLIVVDALLKLWKKQGASILGRVKTLHGRMSFVCLRWDDALLIHWFTLL